jgi:hypothetical protein
MKLSSTGHRASLTKRQLQTRYTKEAKARLRRAVEEVRTAKREARKQRAISAPRLRSLCRGSVKRARIRGRAIVQAALEKARAEARALVATARKGCDRRKEKELRAKGRHIAALELEAERAKERFIAERLGGALERQARALKRSTPKERAQESDDEVRRNLPPELVPVFDSVKKSIRASAGKSRTEAFEEWAEENADEVAARLADQADRETQKMISQLEKRDKALRAMLRRNVVQAADLKALGISCADVESIGGDCDTPADVEATIAELHSPRRRRSSLERAPF